MLSSSVFRFDRPEFEDPCPNPLSQFGSLANTPYFSSQVQSKLETLSSTAKSLTISSKEYKQNSTATTIPTFNTSNYTKNLALTIKALNQKNEIINTLKKSNSKMNVNLQANQNFNSSQSILVTVNGRAKICSKQLSDKLREESLKVKLEEIYSQIENFDRVEIIKIETIK